MMQAVEVNRAAKADRLAALLLKWAITYQTARTMDERDWTELARADMATRHARQIHETNVRPPSPETQQLTLDRLKTAEQQAHEDFHRRLNELAEHVRKQSAPKQARRTQRRKP